MKALQLLWLLLAVVVIALVVIIVMFFPSMEDNIVVQPVLSRETYAFPATDHNRVFSIKVAPDAKVVTNADLKVNNSTREHLFFMKANEDHFVLIDKPSSGLIYSSC